MDTASESNNTILIVEDSHTQALLLQRFLQENGFDAQCVIDARHADEWLENKRPELIISDVIMPDIDGYEFCRSLKNNPATRDIPVVLLTRLTEPEDIVRGLESGADHFITKPFDNAMLLAQINNILLNKQLRSHPLKHEGVEVYFGGRHHVINSQRAQILDLLLSTYESSLQQKRQLEQTNQRLNEALETIKKRNEDIAALAVRDPLTKIYNRGYFNDTFPGVIKQARRYHKHISLIMCDIDNFKYINDRFGHQAGDYVLKQLAHSMEQRLRSGSDWIARFGGEEFVIVLPETDSKGAMSIAEDLRQMVAGHDMRWEDNPLQLTASFGIASCCGAGCDSLNMNSMVAEADRYLYQAKALGRNRSCSA